MPQNAMTITIQSVRIKFSWRLPSFFWIHSIDWSTAYRL